jgi:hypothetical protein
VSDSLGAEAAPPPGTVGSLQLTLYNPLPFPTGAFQEPVYVDSAAYSDLINSNWTNAVVNYSATGTPVPAWIESNATNTSNSTLLWLRVASIGAEGQANLSIFFGPKDSFDLSASGYMGEAPELSARYGAFDNGAAVFNFYDGFKRATLSGGWSGEGAWNYTSGRGFSFSSAPGHGDAIVSARTFPEPAVVDFYGDLFTASGSSAYLAEGLGSSICIVCGNQSLAGWVTPGYGSGPAPDVNNGSGAGDAGQSVEDSPSWGVFTSEPISMTKAVFELDYSDPQTLTTGVPSGPLPIGLAISADPAWNDSNPQTTDWIRERTFLPEFPSVRVREEYTTSFVGFGLPAGEPWNVTFGDRSQSSSNASIAFESPDGAVAYSVEPPMGFVAQPDAGIVTVSGPGLSLLITFLPTELVDFTETGLRAGTSWSVVLNGTVQSSNTTYLLFTVPVGKYGYVVGSVGGYLSTPDDGTVYVGSGEASISIEYSRASPVPTPNTSGRSNSTVPPQFLGLSETEGWTLWIGSALAMLGLGLFIGTRPRRPSVASSKNRRSRPPLAHPDDDFWG